MAEGWGGPLERIDSFRWRVPRRYKSEMRTDGIIYATEEMMQHIRADQAPEQVANVACLPGIVGMSMAMPDIHWGYGFPIGGVAATDMSKGVVSPGGVGYDINCGVRMLRTDLTLEDVKPRIGDLVNQLFRDIPSGVGSEGRIRISEAELAKVARQGAQWAVANGYGWPEDLEVTEQGGKIEGADPSAISDKAVKRGRPQLGTLGAGNHFLEIQVVDEIYDPVAARAMGIEEVGQITVLIHTGSRGFGYQICDDYLVIMQKAVQKYGISLPDRQLACAPLDSPEGKQYLAAMACAANYAWANRQAIAHWTREAFERVLGKSPKELGMRQIYDVAHNIAKIEEHDVNGERRTVCVHRKGATRAFPPGHPAVPKQYRDIGQPVLVPGDMGRYSYLLVGTQQAMKETFGSTCHGAGRVLSRHQAIKQTRGVNITKELADQGITVKAASRETLAEEAPVAYKDVQDVIEAVDGAGISRKVARMRPIGVVKG